MKDLTLPTPALPKLPAPFCTLRLASKGFPVDVAECRQDAEMWAHGCEDVYTAEQMQDYARAALSSHHEDGGRAATDAPMVAACCGRSECGGECGNEWRGLESRPVPECARCKALEARVAALTREAHDWWLAAAGKATK